MFWDIPLQDSCNGISQDIPLWYITGMIAVYGAPYKLWAGGGLRVLSESIFAWRGSQALHLLLTASYSPIPREGTKQVLPTPQRAPPHSSRGAVQGNLV